MSTAYHYIVNPHAGDRSFDAVAPKLKAKLHSLGIDGTFDKTLDVSDTARVARSVLKHGVQTIVAVGGDRTVNEVITAVNESGKSSVSVGIIPLGSRNTLAHQAGIRDWQHGCELLAARRLRSFRLMDVNDYSFIQDLVIDLGENSNTEALLEVDGEYRVKTLLSRCRISNTSLENPHLPDELFLQLHGQLPTQSFWQRTLKLQPNQDESYSQLHARVVVLELPNDVSALVDGRKITDRHFRIRLSQKPVRLISARFNDRDNI